MYNWKLGTWNTKDKDKEDVRGMQLVSAMEDKEPLLSLPKQCDKEKKG